MRGSLNQEQSALVLVDMSYHYDWREAGVFDLMVCILHKQFSCYLFIRSFLIYPVAVVIVVIAATPLLLF